MKGGAGRRRKRRSERGGRWRGGGRGIRSGLGSDLGSARREGMKESVKEIIMKKTATGRGISMREEAGEARKEGIIKRGVGIDIGHGRMREGVSEIDLKKDTDK